MARMHWRMGIEQGIIRGSRLASKQTNHTFCLEE